MEMYQYYMVLMLIAGAVTKQTTIWDVLDACNLYRRRLDRLPWYTSGFE